MFLKVWPGNYGYQNDLACLFKKKKKNPMFHPNLFKKALQEWYLVIFISESNFLEMHTKI